METEERIEDLKWKLVETVMFQILSSYPKYQALLAELNVLQTECGKLLFLFDGSVRKPQKKIRRYAELQIRSS